MVHTGTAFTPVTAPLAHYAQRYGPRIWDLLHRSPPRSVHVLVCDCMHTRHTCWVPAATPLADHCVRSLRRLRRTWVYIVAPTFSATQDTTVDQVHLCHLVFRHNCIAYGSLHSALVCVGCTDAA